MWLWIWMGNDDWCRWLQVTSVNSLGESVEEEYNTVLFAIGRDACTSTIGIEKAGVMLNPK